MMHCTVLALKMQHSAKQGRKTSGSVIVAEKPTPAGVFAASYASAEPPYTDWYLWVRPELGYTECMQRATNALGQ
jgi:hypothetical protein